MRFRAARFPRNELFQTNDALALLVGLHAGALLHGRGMP